MTEQGRKVPEAAVMRGFTVWWESFSRNSAMAQKGIRMDEHMMIAAARAFQAGREAALEEVVHRLDPIDLAKLKGLHDGW